MIQVVKNYSNRWQKQCHHRYTKDHKKLLIPQSYREIVTSPEKDDWLLQIVYIPYTGKIKIYPQIKPFLAVAISNLVHCHASVFLIRPIPSHIKLFWKYRFFGYPSDFKHHFQTLHHRCLWYTIYDFTSAMLAWFNSLDPRCHADTNCTQQNIYMSDNKEWAPCPHCYQTIYPVHVYSDSLTDTKYLSYKRTTSIIHR